MRTRPRLRIAALTFAAALAACGSRDLPATGPATADGAPEYVIGPGDTLDVFVYRSPELSATALPVRPDGRISLPLVPDITAAGRTPAALSRDIAEHLRRYVIEPNVTVMLRGFVGPANHQVRVIGEATQPLAMPYREGMTVLDAVIAARGLSAYAAGNRAEIIRRDGGGTHAIRVRLSDLLRQGDISQDIPLRPGDTLVIPQSWF